MAWYSTSPGPESQSDWDGRHREWTTASWPWKLFGNFTPQPPAAFPNGFLALSVFDANQDGAIDSQDQVFDSLRIWIDANHDGICQPDEMHTLPEVGVSSINLNYKLSGRTDAFGNYFRYMSDLNGQGVSGVGKKAYDVFLTTF